MIDPLVITIAEIIGGGAAVIGLTWVVKGYYGPCPEFGERVGGLGLGVAAWLIAKMLLEWMF